MERTDLDIPEGTVRDTTESTPGEPENAPEEAAAGEDAPVIELGPGDQPPASLDPERDDAERNAASGGWDGANEQIENDFEAEQLRRARPDPDDEDVPLA